MDTWRRRMSSFLQGICAGRQSRDWGPGGDQATKGRGYGLCLAGGGGGRGYEGGQCVRWFKWHQAVRVEDAIDLANKTHGKRRIVGHARAPKIGARGLGFGFAGGLCRLCSYRRFVVEIEWSVLSWASGPRTRSSLVGRGRGRKGDTRWDLW